MHILCRCKLLRMTVIIITFKVLVFEYYIFFCCGSLLPVDAPRINIISFHILIKIGFVGASYMPSRTKIILLLLFWFCAGARPRPSAHEAPGSRGRRTRRAPVRQCVDAPHARIHARSARAAVRGPGGVQFVLGEQGRRSSGPCGTRCPALPFRTFFAHWALGCAATFFFSYRRGTI